MKPIRFATILLAGLTTLGVSAPAGAQDSQPAQRGRMILTGNARGLWLLRRGEKDKSTYSLVHRRPDGKWKWIRDGRKGNVAAAVAIDGQLHVISEEGGYHIFGSDTNDVMPGFSLKATPLTICAAGKRGGKVRGSLLAIFGEQIGPIQTSQPTTAAATGPATQPQPTTGESAPRNQLAGLVVRQSLDADWPELIQYDGKLSLGSRDRVLAAMFDRTLLLMIARDGDGPNELLAWDGRWRNIKLSEPAANSLIPAMLVVDKRLVLVLAKLTGDNTLELTLAVADSAAVKSFTYHPVKTVETVQSWPRRNPPLVAPLIDKKSKGLALVWTKGDAIKLASCDLKGNITPLPDVDIFNKPHSSREARELLEKILWGVMLLIFVLMLVLRPRRAAVPFVLPEGVRPGRLTKRMVAGLIDLLPFIMLATPLIPMPENPDDWNQWSKEILQETPLTIVFYYLVCIGLYTTYSIIMEWWRGATLGKMAMQLRVVATNAKPPGLREVLLRNLARVIPLLMLHLLPLLVVFPLLNRYRQRLGDMLAHTAVIDASIPLPTISEPQSDETPDETPDDTSPNHSD